MRTKIRVKKTHRKKRGKRAQEASAKKPLFRKKLPANPLRKAQARDRFLEAWAVVALGLALVNLLATFLMWILLESFAWTPLTLGNFLFLMLLGVNLMMVANTSVRQRRQGLSPESPPVVLWQE